MKIELMEIFQRVETWPEQDQETLARMMLEIEAGKHAPYDATEEELRLIDEGLAALDRGEIASDEKVRAVFEKFRRP